MKTANVGISANSYILGDDGRYVGTVLAETHGLGANVFVDKALHRNDDLTFENVLLSYLVDIDGNVKVYASEPVSLRLTIATDF